ncbi:MAG TPA: cupin domain-containing protein [Vicinamibacterales bacterium]|jgi:quercetin dioxygenase-like cupin family protein|nr:cupin domain-containing protein [Vicinamibacterales bacterium]HEX2460004.1 cupin domain-containing protein [Vicinamibacterales bacterium]
MIRRPLFTLLLNLIASAALVAQSSTQAKPGQATDARYDDRQWQAIVPELGADSPQVSILRVDPVTQATQLLIRVPKQIHVPVHWHSANETHTVIRGTWTFEHEGIRHQLGPGGFNYIPAKMRHQAWASDDALVFITVDSAWDINWETGPPTKASLGKTPDVR